MPRLRIGKSYFVLLAGLIGGCGGATEGSERGACFPNNTCNAGLVCLSGRCVRETDAGAVDAPRADIFADQSAIDALVDSSTTEVAADTAADSGSNDVVTPDTAVDAGILDTGAIDSATSDAGIADTGIADSGTTDGGGPDAGAYPETTFASTGCDDLASRPDVAGVIVDNGASAITALPFTFRFFGSDMGFYSMSSNGFAQLWPSNAGTPATTAANLALPSGTAPANLLAPFWDDLTPIFSNARVGVVGTAPNRHYTIQWGHWSLTGTPMSRLTIEIRLFESTNVIEFRYCALDGGVVPADIARATGGSATVGVQNAAGTLARLHSFNTPMSLMTGTGLRFTP